MKLCNNRSRMKRVLLYKVFIYYKYIKIRTIGLITNFNLENFKFFNICKGVKKTIILIYVDNIFFISNYTSILIIT